MSSRASYNFSRFKLLNYTTSTRSTPQPYKSYNYLSNPSALRVGWSKTAFDTLLPVISDCLTLKSTQGFDRMRVGYFEQQATDRNNKRHIDDSFLELVMPLIENHELRDSLIAPRIGQEDRGAVIRYGKLLEILDALAGEVSYRHCIGSKLPQPAYIVTASVDSMNIKHDIDIGKSDLCIQGYLSFVGRSSMQVSIDIISLSISGEQEIVANTNFIMVARSKEGKSAEVPGLSLTTDAAISVFERSKILIAEGIERAKLSVTKVSPLPDEVNLIHSLFLATKAIEKQKEKLITIDKIRAVNLVDSTIEACKVYTHTLPFKWTAETVYKSCVLMHYQSRNIHGNIFGGYIMRE
jgi:acyl-coenzyme A thioesterase 9